MKNNDFDDILNDCVDGLIEGQGDIETCASKHPDQADELVGLLTIARCLMEVQSPPEGDAKARIRERFLARAASMHRPFWKKAPSLFFRPVLAGTAIGLVVLSFSYALGTAVANDSLPGDTFYPVKLTLEKVDEALARDSVAKAEVSLELAERRYEELLQIQSKPEQVSGDFLGSLANQTRLAGETVSVPGTKEELNERLDDLLDRQEGTLDHLIPLTSEKSKAGLEKAIDVTRQEKERSEQRKGGPLRSEPEHETESRNRQDDSFRVTSQVEKRSSEESATPRKGEDSDVKISPARVPESTTPGAKPTETPRDSNKDDKSGQTSEQSQSSDSTSTSGDGKSFSEDDKSTSRDSKSTSGDGKSVSEDDKSTSRDSMSNSEEDKTGSRQTSRSGDRKSDSDQTDTAKSDSASTGRNSSDSNKQDDKERSDAKSGTESKDTSRLDSKDSRDKQDSMSGSQQDSSRSDDER